MLIALNINNEAVVDCRVICRAQPRPVDDEGEARATDREAELCL